MPKKLQPKKPAAALESYRTKRNFDNTPEPSHSGKSIAGKSFVVQEHHARSHHFDFRIEIDGVLVSWAVPKGIPESEDEKRLAVHVEDHPLEYGKFEGTIPPGNYGAGEVTIWDSGSWNPVERTWRKSFEAGKLKFHLQGSKLNGTYVLARMKEEPNWLFRKISTPRSADLLDKEKPAFVSPQLAKVVSTVPDGENWIHELKLDGYRLIVVREGRSTRLFTRSGLDWTEKFSNLAKQLAALPGADFVLDGEAVVFDAKGKSHFGSLQEALKSSGEAIVFVAFDLLHDNGLNLRSLPLSERINRLAKRIPQDTDSIRISKTWPPGSGSDLFKQACKLGLEGIISKDASAPYLAGARRGWVKSKCRPRQEFVICGYTAPRNSCPAFGALVLGSFEGGKLIPRGKVGTGFTDSKRTALLEKMQSVGTARRHFTTPKDEVTWINPELVAEIEFAELTTDGSIRQGSYISLREDKPPSDVHLDPVQKTTDSKQGVKSLGITITHPDRNVYPDDSITKLEVAKYYERVANLILPHLKNRPLAIVRAPDGIGGDMFFQKSFKTHIPDHVHVAEEDGNQLIHIKDAKGLISLAQFGVLEIHPWGSSFPDLDKPDQLIWDLDPDTAVPWKEVLGTAFLLRDFLAERNLETIVKTSGGKGLHVILPLRKTQTWEALKPFSKAVATAVAAFNPKKLLVDSSLKKRTGKIYIDWLRNGKGATCIAPWCLRARKGAGVSTPLDWADLPNLEPAGFTIHSEFTLPDDWKNTKRQTVTKAHLEEFL